MQKLQKLNNRLYYLPYEEATDRPILSYIKGDKYSIAIDAGNSKRHVELFYDELKKNNLPLPSLTIITHWHWDHTFGLKYINGLSISSKKTYDKLNEVKKWIWTKEEMKKREHTKEDIPFCNEHIVIEYPDLNEIQVVNTDIFINNKVTINLGGIEILLIPFPSTHCDDSLFIYLKELDTMIVGDGDSPDFYNGEVYDKEKIKNLISFYESFDYSTHIFSHYDITTKEDTISMLKEEYAKL